MEPHKTIWDQFTDLSGLIWYQKNKKEIEISKFLWVGRRKGKRFFTACAFARLRGGRAKPERKDLPFGPAKCVRLGRIEVEGCPTSAGAWETSKNLKVKCLFFSLTRIVTCYLYVPY